MRDAADEKAIFCLNTGVQPSEYSHLTLAEREAFTRNDKRRRK